MNKMWILVIAIILFIVIIILYRWTIHRKQAIDDVLNTSDENKIKEINDALDIYGFVYDISNDIICSQMYPWQRNMGYCRLYDELAPSLNMIIDSEPIYFDYDGRRWLIEFWKGQYGMTTGGEIGIYVTDREDVNIPGVFLGPFFESVTDKERLSMRFNLKKEGKSLFKRKKYHWWLTGFDVGVFSKPRNLSMDIRLIFNDYRMKEAFLIGLMKAGYRQEDYKVVNNMVYITFDTPKSNQPIYKYKLVLPFIQLANKFYCKLYNFLTKDFNCTLDKIYFLCSYYPILFNILAGDKVIKGLESTYELIQSYLSKNEADNNEHS